MQTDDAVESLELAIRNAGDWSKFWGKKNSPLSKMWAKSRQEMFATQGRSTGTPWPAYTPAEKMYWLPIKRWALGTKRIEPRHILRWDKSPSTKAGVHERLYPSLAMVNHPEYIWSVTGNSVEMGTAVPYASNHNDGTGSYTRKFSHASAARAVNHAQALTDAAANAKDLKSMTAARKRAQRAIATAKRKVKNARKGSVTIPTPKRPLVTLGPSFMDDLRYALGMQASAMGGKVGILDSEFAARFAMNGGKIGL